MPAEVVTGAVRVPRRARYLIPRGLPRRGEFIAACAVLVIVGHVLFAQLTLVVAVVCYLIGKATRWRASWLLIPATAGLAWLLALGPGAAAAGFTAGPARVTGYLTAGGHQAAHFLHIGAAFAGAGSWLPRQLPLAILAGAAEAAVASWLTWLHTDEWNLPRSRPGPFVAVRRAAVIRSIRGGAVVTRDGCCLGVVPDTGGKVTLSWPEADGGTLVYGSTGPELLTTSFQLVYAALRRHKPVVVVDFTGDHGVPKQLAAACAAAGVALQVFGGTAGGSAGSTAGGSAGIPQASYEPFRHGDPAERAALLTGMLSWEGPGSHYRRSCAAYLADVFELLDAAPGDPRVPVLDEVIHLLDPAALQARARYVPAIYPRREVLAERTRVSASLVTAEPASTAVMSQQLRALRASGAGRWLGQPVGRQLSAIDLGQTVSGRTAVLFCLRDPASGAAGAIAEPGPSGVSGVSGSAGTDVHAMLTRLVCQDLLRLAGTLQRTGVHGDGIVWLAGCQAIPPQALADLFTAGQGAGLAVVATTGHGQAAGAVAEYANAMVLHQMTDHATAPRLAAAAGRRLPSEGTALPTSLPGSVNADDLLRLAPGEFLLSVARPRRVVPRAVAVRARVRAVARQAQAGP